MLDAELIEHLLTDQVHIGAHLTEDQSSMGHLNFDNSSSRSFLIIHTHHVVLNKRVMVTIHLRNGTYTLSKCQVVTMLDGCAALGIRVVYAVVLKYLTLLKHFNQTNQLA